MKTQGKKHIQQLKPNGKCVMCNTTRVKFALHKILGISTSSQCGIDHVNSWLDMTSNGMIDSLGGCISAKVASDICKVINMTSHDEVL
jgi:hypothetical protein